nr:probable RNA-dependent RNA polymerase 5 isoform X2 [Tanacetum cinerariifolium]
NACYVFPHSKKLIPSPYSPSINKTIPEYYPCQKQVNFLNPPKTFNPHLDWDYGKTYVYHCYMSIDGTYRSRELGDDNVLIVQFTDDLDPDMPFDQQCWIADRQTISNKISIDHLDWGSGKTYVYHCYVSIDGTYRSRELGDDNVLIVQYTDDLDPDMPFDQQSWIADRQKISNKISIDGSQLALPYLADILASKSNIGPVFLDIMSMAS